MDKLTSSQFNSRTASTTAHTDSGSAVLDKLMPPSDGRVALKPRQKSAPQRQTQRRQQTIQSASSSNLRNADESVKSDSFARQGRAADLMRQPPLRTPDTRPQATVQAPVRSPYNVNVIGISEGGAAPTNSLEVKVSKSFLLKNDSKLNAAFFVQDKTSMSVRTTTVGASGEIEQKFSTGNANTSITAKAKIAGKILKSNTQTTAEVKLGVAVRADHKFDKSTSAYGSVGGTAVFSTASPPTATVRAELEVQKVISSGNNVITAKAKIAGEIANLPPQTTAKAELGVSVRAEQKIDESTSGYVSVGGNAVFSNMSAPITTLSAELGLDKVLSADGKLKGSVYGGVDQVLGSNSAPYAGLKASYNVAPTTTVSGDIRVQKESSEVRLTVDLSI